MEQVLHFVCIYIIIDDKKSSIIRILRNIQNQTNRNILYDFKKGVNYEGES